jgi:hypothetical protein
MKKLLILLFLFTAFKANSQTNYQRDSMALDPIFQTRVRVSTISASKDILAATGQPIYLFNYCQLIISDPTGKQGWLPAMSYGVASAPAINFNSTDSDIQFTVNSNISHYAQAYFQITTTDSTLNTLNKIFH